MLREIDLDKKLSGKEFKEQYDSLCEKLSAMQREVRKLKIPVMISFDGWSASGKGTQINMLLQALDPRGFTVENISHKLEHDEALHPYLWRFWEKTPPRGEIAIFDRSWYMTLFDEDSTNEQAARHIREFERELTDDGYVLIKFFLHVSKKEQKRRLEALEKGDATSWRVGKHDKKQNKDYEKLCAQYASVIQSTNMAEAPWTIVEAEERKYAAVKIMGCVVDRLQLAIEQARTKTQIPATPQFRSIGSNDILDRVDLSKTLEREEYKDRLEKAQAKLFTLQNEMYRLRIPLICVFEGWDAAGKGGAIKRLTRRLDPRGYNVIPSSAPNDIEKSHNYLWRYWTKMPKAGHMAVFDRSWYGRVMVERIEGFARPDEWQRAYQEINDMEKQLADWGAVICKFWLHIDKDEQERRFIERRDNPQKSWKLTDEDWRNRDKWDEYVKAVDEMMVLTSTAYAPWTIVEANSKYYARVKVIETVTDALEAAIKRKEKECNS